MLFSSELDPAVRLSLNPADVDITDATLVEKALRLRGDLTPVPGVGSAEKEELLVCDLLGDLGWRGLQAIRNSGFADEADSVAERLFAGSRYIAKRVVCEADEYMGSSTRVGDLAKEHAYGRLIVCSAVMAGLTEAGKKRVNGGPSIRHALAVGANLEMADRFLSVRHPNATRLDKTRLGRLVAIAFLHDTDETSTPKDGSSPYAVPTNRRRIVMKRLQLECILEELGLGSAEQVAFLDPIRRLTHRRGVTGLVEESRYMAPVLESLDAQLVKLSDGTNNAKQDSKQAQGATHIERKAAERRIRQKEETYKNRENDILLKISQENPILHDYALALTEVTEEGLRWFYKNRCRHNLVAALKPKTIDEWLHNRATDFRM